MYGKPLFLFDNMLADAGAVITASTSSSDYPVQNLYDFRTYTWWKSLPGPNPYVYIEAASGRQADFLYMSTTGFNSGALLSLTSSNADGSGAVNNSGVVDVSGMKEVLVLFAQSTRVKWYLDFAGITDFPSVSSLIIGNKLELPRNLQQGFDPLGSKPRGRLSKSSKGQPLGIAEDWREWKQKIRFNNIDAAWLRSTWQPAFDSHLRNTPSVFVWDPVDHPTELHLVHPVYDYVAPHMQGQFANLSFTLEGLAL